MATTTASDLRGLSRDELNAKRPLYAAQAAQATAHAGVYNNMLEVAKTNKEAGAAMQPFLDKIAGLADPTGADKAEAERLMLQAAAAGATKSKDVAALYTQMQKPNRSVVSAEREKAAYAALNAVIGNPQLVAQVKAEYPEVFGEDPLVAALKKKLAGGGAGNNTAGGGTEKNPPPAAAAPQPQGALPLSSRLATAIGKDNSAGNRNQFTTLATEVEQKLPQINQQIRTLESALPMAKTASEKANIKAKIDELKADLPIMQGILEQRRAAIGY